MGRAAAQDRTDVICTGDSMLDNGVGRIALHHVAWQFHIAWRTDGVRKSEKG
jgi:hypothetical protein